MLQQASLLHLRHRRGYESGDGIIIIDTCGDAVFYKINVGITLATQGLLLLYIVPSHKVRNGLLPGLTSSKEFGLTKEPHKAVHGDGSER